jgi:glycosyltransferase involved in cell wall biosynthesis
VNYYRPTSFSEKVKKIFLIFIDFFRSNLNPARKREPLAYSILMLVPQVDRVGGYERQALELSFSLTEIGNFVSVLTNQRQRFPAREFRNGFLITRLNGSTPVVLFQLFRFLITRKKRFQILHAHGVTGFSLTAARIAKFLKKPVCLKPATSEDVRTIVQSKSTKTFFYKRWLRKIDCLIAISLELKDEMLSCGIEQDRIAFIPNAVDTRKFIPATTTRKQQLRKRFGVTLDDTMFLFMGRFEKRKGADVLLRAWQELEEGILWIVGAGAEESALQKIAKELRLQRVQFLGGTLNPLDYYQAADVFILPSIQEGFPNVILEAMSCGLPCIASEIGGVTDILKQDSQGILVPPGDPDALSEAMKRILSSQKDRIRWSQSALRTVQENYNFDRVLADYVNLYSNLILSPGSTSSQ